MKSGQRSVNPATPSKSQKEAQQQRRRIKVSTIVCWNCRKTGHIFRDCRSPKQIFCFSCENVGKTTRNCDKDHFFIKPSDAAEQSFDKLEAMCLKGSKTIPRSELQKS